jgi:hypothetical protein
MSKNKKNKPKKSDIPPPNLKKNIYIKLNVFVTILNTSPSCPFYCSDSAAPCSACPAGGARHHHRHGGGSLPGGLRVGAAQPRLQPGRAPAPPQGEYGEPGGRLSRPSGGSGGPGLPYGENRRPDLVLHENKNKLRRPGFLLLGLARPAALRELLI